MMSGFSSQLRGRRRARPLPVVLVASLAMISLVLLGLALAPTPAIAQEVKEGVVIVQLDATAQVVRPFTFTGQISGLEVLQLSGLEVVTTTTSFGPAVCSIEGVGCPAEDCFCNASKYWAYNLWDGVAWQSYSTGAGSSVINQTGSIEGWRWGEFGEAQTPAPAGLAAADALAWLGAQQSAADGGYGSASATVETLLALGANNLDAEQWRRGDKAPSLAAAALAVVPAYTRGGAAAAGKSAAGLAATKLCLPAVAMRPDHFYIPTSAIYSIQSGPNAWALLGAAAIQEQVAPQAITGLRGQALAGGSWEWAPGWGADSNTTALALQVLLARGEPLTATVIAQGLAYLKSVQNPDGGFAYNLNNGSVGASDANSTAYVVQALMAAGEDVHSAAWQVGGKGPIDYLLSMQQADGSFAWQAGSGPNLLATQQVIPALLGRTLPIGRSSGITCPTLFLTDVWR